MVVTPIKRDWIIDGGAEDLNQWPLRCDRAVFNLSVGEVSRRPSLDSLFKASDVFWRDSPKRAVLRGLVTLTVTHVEPYSSRWVHANQTAWSGAADSDAIRRAVNQTLRKAGWPAPGDGSEELELRARCNQ
jgi:hypothetical protein